MLALIKVTYIPTAYILPRWRKNVKRKYTFLSSHFQDLREQPYSYHFDKLYHKFFEIAEIGVESDVNCELLMGVLDEWKDKFAKCGSICGSSMPIESPSQLPLSFDESRVVNPIAVRSKGRVPFKRRMSKVDQVIKSKRRKAQI